MPIVVEQELAPPVSNLGNRPQRSVTIRGAPGQLFQGAHDPEIMIEGPYGTGKTRGILEYVHHCLLTYPGSRWLMLRKTMVSLTNSALVTYREQVLQPGQARFFGGSKDRPAAFQYYNGSELVVGGMDNPDKVLSTEFDGAYWVEATEGTETEWESVGGRLRRGVMPYQQQLGDCNPRGPNHWIPRRAARGQLRMLTSRHHHNPAYYDIEARDWTELGRAYLTRLSGSLTGVRRKRFLDGIWAAAEGLVYETWDPDIHVLRKQRIPRDWPRVWSIDFGFTNPFVLQCWAFDGDDRAVMEWEIYHTQRLVSEHAKHALEAARARITDAGTVDWSRGIKPIAIVADHDAEDRRTFESIVGMRTTPAYKSVSAGIQAVEARLRTAADGRPRMFLLAGATLERDRSLVDAFKPASTQEEFDSYIWDVSDKLGPKEQPVKKDDHGMDTSRYMVAYRDRVGRSRVQAL